MLILLQRTHGFFQSVVASTGTLSLPRLGTRTRTAIVKRQSLGARTRLSILKSFRLAIHLWESPGTQDRQVDLKRKFARLDESYLADDGAAFTIYSTAIASADGAKTYEKYHHHATLTLDNH
ncbi:MAG: hypothetical protein FJ145_23325 [Deltaproteobacteria bacterium]|nr:hypothetical protein [Deltaproteobacteria bacterium]